MLSSKYRFHGRRSIAFLLRKGRTMRGGTISAKFVQSSRHKSPRIAVVVGRKVSKSAPVRNRIRRRIYEVVRLHLQAVPQGCDIAFFVYDASVATLPAAQLEAQITALLKTIPRP